MMSDTATFTIHIRNIVKKDRDKMLLVLRVFPLRERSLVLTLLKSHAIPLLYTEYSYLLWNPWKANDIQAIEAIKRTFTYRITEVKHLNYLETLHELKLYFFQRRRERHKIIFIWNNITAYGAKCWWYNGTQNRNQKTTKTGNSVLFSTQPTEIQRNPFKKVKFHVFGHRLYNSLPKYLRDIESVKT